MSMFDSAPCRTPAVRACPGVFGVQVDFDQRVVAGDHGRAANAVHVGSYLLQVQVCAFNCEYGAVSPLFLLDGIDERLVDGYTCPAEVGVCGDVRCRGI